MGSRPGQSGGSEAVDLCSLGHTPTAKVADPWSVDKVLETMPRNQVPSAGASSPLAFFHMLERLKTTKREGWRRFGIER
ncbi:hypothetical protein CDD83_8614 [Cordyceps sp. RAO-2017]|nr:hypothetical protein CDD83_8614 [Cordyceps sp. RAO-2017]